MTDEQLSALIDSIRQQANTWLGDEACENIERLIKHTYHLRSLLSKQLAGGEDAK